MTHPPTCNMTGREGLDFRAAIAQPFRARIEMLVKKALEESRDSFEKALNSQRFTSMPATVQKRYQEALEGGGGGGVWSVHRQCCCHSCPSLFCVSICFYPFVTHWCENASA